MQAGFRPQELNSGGQPNAQSVTPGSAQTVATTHSLGRRPASTPDPARAPLPRSQRPGSADSAEENMPLPPSRHLAPGRRDEHSDTRSQPRGGSSGASPPRGT